MTHFDPITLVVVLALLSLVPLAAVMMTSFLKIAIVLSLVRNALGVQQVPPNMALYGRR
jgi:type III secretion protein R